MTPLVITRAGPEIEDAAMPAHDAVPVARPRSATQACNCMRLIGLFLIWASRNAHRP
ncbi:hypothetical protein PQ455_11205 [Sphingomonas naphthae]|uniref:Uncharacterized protein n=1 Tax=Sphingomonas naphthae TaxID=1813468 RepID=A0ABY7TGZ6_9SPHN|nr:hypothetical protein [Sphingomonas naphthae]WCT72210.1 hypothetical protein PQ455_11205 [Sphingomonas naphthae]